MFRSRAITGIPVLARGKHRSPRSGACFMEYASFLAGERWSDSPDCTHPLLAGLARGVNDAMADDHRHELVELVPSVVGLAGGDADGPALDLRIGVRCAATALPHVAGHHQRSLAVGILVADRLATGEHGLPDASDHVFDHARRALESLPVVRARAGRLVSGHAVDLRTYRRRTAPLMVRIAVDGLAEAEIPDRDAALAALLTEVIGDCRRWLGLDRRPDLVEAHPSS